MSETELVDLAFSRTVNNIENMEDTGLCDAEVLGKTENVKRQEEALRRLLRQLYWQPCSIYHTELSTLSRTNQRTQWDTSQPSMLPAYIFSQRIFDLHY